MAMWWRCRSRAHPFFVTAARSFRFLKLPSPNNSRYRSSHIGRGIPDVAGRQKPFFDVHVHWRATRMTPSCCPFRLWRFWWAFTCGHYIPPLATAASRSYMTRGRLSGDSGQGRHLAKPVTFGSLDMVVRPAQHIGRASFGGLTCRMTMTSEFGTFDGA